EAHLAAPVPEVRHRDVISDDCDLPRHVVEFLTQAPDVHENEDRGKRPALLRMDHEAVHAAIGGRDVDMLLDHCSLISALLTIGPHKAFSWFMRSVRRSGGPPSVRAPSVANCFFASSVLQNAQRARLIFMTTSGRATRDSGRSLH